MIKLYPVRIPRWLQALLPAYTWRIPTREKVLYLTFDDGPIPEVTPWVLDQLKSFGAKASFFCVGDNVRKYPEIFQRLQLEGHSVGNHTFNHLNGSKVPASVYLDNVEQCAQLVKTNLFRPPYGRVNRTQRSALKKRYQIVMWDVLSGDFDAGTRPDECRDHIIRNAGPGSIIVMHDSLKAARNMTFALPEILRYFTEKGYRFEALGNL